MPRAARLLAVLTAVTTCILLLLLLLVGRLESRPSVYEESDVSPSAAVSASDAFAVRFPLNFPLTTGVWPVAEVLSAAWVADLKAFLSALPSKTVNIVTADSKYLPILLNWLIMAMVKLSPPLEHTLVVALDKPLYSLLLSKHIPCVYASMESVVDQGAMHSEWSHIWIIRGIVLRLLNHWGYDVATFDCDALVLRHPESLFARYPDSDIVASSGKYPFEVGKQWAGPTLCMGMALFRASNRTEAFWEITSRIMRNSLDDQNKINYGILHSGVDWGPLEADSAREGRCRNGLRVTLLPNSAVCRNCAPQWMDIYYVWHQLSGKSSDSKVGVENFPQLWHLRRDWRETTFRESGIAWLQRLTKL